MSDSGRDDGRPAKHPCIVAFEQYQRAMPRSFEGNADGRYLANRLQEAFQEGWAACERLVRNAMEGR